MFSVDMTLARALSRWAHTKKRQEMNKLRRVEVIAAAIGMLSLIQGELGQAAEAAPRGASAPVVVMDNQGRVIKTLTPELSREAIAAKAADAERALATAKADEDQKRKDRVLFDSYTTEAEIDLARNRATSVLEAQMEIGTAYTAMLAKRRLELVKRKADAGNKPLPPAEEQELARLDSAMEQQSAVLAQKKQDLERVLARYAADKKRWQEISGKSPATPPVATTPTPK
jgi:hypothetical protein